AVFGETGTQDGFFYGPIGEETTSSPCYTVGHIVILRPFWNRFIGDLPEDLGNSPEYSKEHQFLPFPGPPNAPAQSRVRRLR
ncbi:hypothetical protein, partial [Methanoculleus sp. UBA416]|uniref:hypothetical protein n=1 Tax=Methanoculleus sp. UBA416 TaxID=1915510 RepID=UPI00319EABCF